MRKLGKDTWSAYGNVPHQCACAIMQMQLESDSEAEVYTRRNTGRDEGSRAA